MLKFFNRFLKRNVIRYFSISILAFMLLLLMPHGRVEAWDPPVPDITITSPIVDYVNSSFTFGAEGSVANSIISTFSLNLLSSTGHYLGTCNANVPFSMSTSLSCLLNVGGSFAFPTHFGMPYTLGNDTYILRARLTYPILKNYSEDKTIIVDTNTPVVTFTDDVVIGPVSSETVEIVATDVNLDSSSLKYGFVSTPVECNSSIDGLLDNSYSSGVSFIFANQSVNGKYVCAKAGDLAGNVTYVSSINPINVLVLESPHNYGWNVKNSPSDSYTTPRPTTELVCGSYTNINGVSIHWSDVSQDLSEVKYERQYKVGGGGWAGSEVYETPYSNFRTFGGGTLANQNVYDTRVRAFYDANSNNVYDLGEIVSDWSDNSCTITYDIVAPASSFTTDISGTLTNSPLHLVGESTDNFALDFVNLYYKLSSDLDEASSWHPISQLALSGTSDTWIYDWTPSSDGTYDVKAEATDMAGNEEHTAMMTGITYDHTPPTMPTWGTIYKKVGSSWVEVGCDGYTNTTNVKFVWNTNTESDLNGYWFGTKFNDHHKYVTSPTNFYVANMTPGNNPYFYTIIAKDNAGNESVKSLQCGLTLDQVAPVVDVTSHSNGDHVSGTVTVKGKVVDENLWRYWFVVHNSSGVQVAGPGTVYNSGTNITPSFSWNTKLVPNGTYTIKLEARDKADNKDSSSVEWVTVIVDNTAPLVNITNPSDGDVLGGVVDIKGLVQDENLSHYNIAIYKGGDNTWDFSKRIEQSTVYGPEFGEMSIFSWDTTNGLYPDGEYQIRLAARDLAENRDPMSGPGFGDSVMVITVVVDNGNPTVSSLVDQEFNEGDDIPVIEVVGEDANLQDLCFSVSGPNGFVGSDCVNAPVGVSSHTWYVHEILSDALGDAITKFDTSVIDEGVYNISYYTEDIVGNVSETKEVNYTVFNVAPVVTFVGNQTIDQGSQAVFSGEFEDPSYIPTLSLSGLANFAGNPADDSDWKVSIDYGLGAGFGEIAQMSIPGAISVPSQIYNTSGIFNVTLEVCEAGETILELALPSLVSSKGEGECTTATVLVTVNPVGDNNNENQQQAVQGQVLGAQDQNDEQDDNDEDRKLADDTGVVLGVGPVCTQEEMNLVSGYVYQDGNGNGQRDEGEQGVKDVKIYIYYTDAEGVKVLLETVFTDENGYWAASVCPSEYTIEIDTQTLPEGYALSSEEQKSVTVGEEDLLGVSFLVASEDEETQTSSSWWWIALILGLVALLAGGYYYLQRKRVQ